MFISLIRDAHELKFLLYVVLNFEREGHFIHETLENTVKSAYDDST
jgi:hypothetical protein